MKTYASVAFNTIVIFIVSYLLNFGMERLSLEKGAIEVTKINFVSNEQASQIRIENYSQKSIDGLKILVPQLVDVSKILTSNVIQITENAKDLSSSEFKVIELSLIPNEKVSTIIVPLLRGKVDPSVKTIMSRV